MPFIAIVGAGAIGGALAHRLAARNRVQHVRLIDADGTIAQGKALDILQAAPLEGFSTRVSWSTSIEAAAGSAAVVIADTTRGDAEHAGEPGLHLVRRLASFETEAPLLFAGAGQRELMLRTVGELHVRRRRTVGCAPLALQGAVRALTALEVEGTGADVQALVLGVPPRNAVIAWEAATVWGQPASTLIPPHRLAAISARLPGLWPPGPLALAAAASRVVEAVVNGSRRRLTCFAALDEPGAPSIVAVPVELGPDGIERVLRPALSRNEQTAFENSRGAG